MKKLLLSILLLAATVTAFAQFKVQSDNNIAIQTNSTALSPISINSAGNPSYYIYCGNISSKSGMYLSAYGNNSNSTIYGGSFFSSSASTAIGLKGNASTSATNIGVLGNADAGTKSIGLLGCVNQSYISTGAGVYGTVFGDVGSGLSTGDKYAGFFRGNVKATGSIAAGTTIQGALLGESASGSESLASGQFIRSSSITSGLSGLLVTSYQKERPKHPEDTETIYTLDGDTTVKAEIPQPDVLDEQFYEKNHFALDAERLEEIFPDLVYVNKDGSKVINYMEMIPLLVQSINELSAEIAELKQASDEKAKSGSRGTTDIEESIATQNKLYQNAPNPFKEQTIIRFSLASDVKDAAICIFDMTGKILKKLPVSQGQDSVSVGGYELGEGMFLYSLIVNGQEIDTKKMIIMK